MAIPITNDRDDDNVTGLDTYVLQTFLTTVMAEPDVVTIEYRNSVLALPRSEWDHLCQLVKGNPS